MIARRKRWMRTLDAVLAAAVTTAIVSVGILDKLEYGASDRLYQKLGMKSPDILVIDMDAATLSQLGPIPTWIRREMANAIDRLNNTDPDMRPAVIGIDWIFSGNNQNDPETDARLAEVAGQYGNVVVASEADMNNADSRNAETEAWAWDASFPALTAATDTGHINGPDDPDGIIRHDFLYVDVEDRGRLYSFARVIYEKWCQANGETANLPPTTNEDGIFYIPFSAKTYRQGITFSDLLDGKVPPETYHDKIVLIGVCAVGMGDDFVTSLDHAHPMYGIDIHANVIQAFQEGFFPHEASNALQMVLLFLICMAAEFFFLDRKMRHMGMVWVGICLGWLVICKIAYLCGVVLHVLWVPLSVSVLFVGSVAFNYIRSQAEKKRILDTFVRYVDPAILGQLLEKGEDALDTNGQMCEIAVLFVDIRGFTSMSEKLPPQDIVEILNRYLTLTTECIHRYHGTLDKFVGDCTMAFWNAPLPQEQPVFLACQAALDMLDGAKRLGGEIRARYGHDISFGIGIHWGSAVVGNVGSPVRMDYTAIGDTVNTAARLEENAHGGKILISRAVADALGDCANATSLGDTIKLKGKGDSFEILELRTLTKQAEGGCSSIG